MRVAPVVARAALVCGLAGAAWCAFALNPDTARADDRPAAVADLSEDLLGTVRDVVDEVLPPPADEPAAPDEPVDQPDDTGDEPAEDPTPADETAPAPSDNPPPDAPVIELPPVELPIELPAVEVPSIEVPIDLPVVPPITVTTPPVVVQVPALVPAAAPATTPAPTMPAPVVVTLPIVSPVTQPAASTDAAPAPTSAVTPELAAHVSDPAGLPVPIIGPVLGHAFDDGNRPPEPTAEASVKVGGCSEGGRGHGRSLDEVRRAVIALTAGDDRRDDARAAGQVTRPCPGPPLGPDADVTGMAATHGPGTSSTDQLLSDTPGVLIWPAVDRLAALRARSAIPPGRLTHLDPRPA
ncbi:hypothetical protein [Micromonospora sp. NPDC048839]|uniref:hypothetical protein n=1 Tax=Micromonospora sp. NPDC048839 TaxID=3155641 RepID=UPI0033D85E2D